jgi:hypothetical protein
MIKLGDAAVVTNETRLYASPPAGTFYQEPEKPTDTILNCSESVTVVDRLLINKIFRNVEWLKVRYEKEGKPAEGWLYNGTRSVFGAYDQSIGEPGSPCSGGKP